MVGGLNVLTVMSRREREFEELFAALQNEMPIRTWLPALLTAQVAEGTLRLYRARTICRSSRTQRTYDIPS